MEKLEGEVESSDSERSKSSRRDEEESRDDDIVLYGNDLRRVIRKYAYGDQPDVGGGGGGYNEGDRQSRDVVLERIYEE